MRQIVMHLIQLSMQLQEDGLNSVTTSSDASEALKYFWKPWY